MRPSVLFACVAVGLYPLAKTGLFDLVREHKIGTEVFVTIATVIAMIGREYIAGARRGESRIRGPSGPTGSHRRGEWAAVASQP